MEKIAVFPGSFDPITIGHESVIRRALPLFDKIIIAIGINSEKKYFFPLEKRIQWIKELFDDEPKIEVDYYTGLTIEYCKKIGANYLLRGLRTSADFEYERIIAQMNKSMYPQLDTIFLLTLPEHSHISSTIVREIIINGGNPEKFVPSKIKII
mgnify:CR=1 FL=1